MFFACGIWCLADVSSVSSVLRRRANAPNVSYTPYSTGEFEKHTISTFVDQTRNLQNTLQTQEGAGIPDLEGLGHCIFQSMGAILFFASWSTAALEEGNNNTPLPIPSPPFLPYPLPH